MKASDKFLSDGEASRAADLLHSGLAFDSEKYARLVQLNVGWNLYHLLRGIQDEVEFGGWRPSLQVAISIGALCSAIEKNHEDMGQQTSETVELLADIRRQSRANTLALLSALNGSSFPFARDLVPDADA